MLITLTFQPGSLSVGVYEIIPNECGIPSSIQE